MFLSFTPPISEIETNLKPLGQFFTTMKDTYGCDIVFLPFGMDYGGEIQGRLIAKSFDNVNVYDISKSSYLDISKANFIIKMLNL